MKKSDFLLIAAFLSFSSSDAQTAFHDEDNLPRLNTDQKTGKTDTISLTASYLKKILEAGAANEAYSKQALHETSHTLHQLREKVLILEGQQSRQEQEQLAIYQANYETALVNLISMEREIKPLHLFNATREFVTSLSNATNPMHYPGYRQWYEKFQEYMDKNKTKDPAISVLSQLLFMTGDLSKGIFMGGPVTEPLFSAMTGFVRSLGGNIKKAIREESERMFLLTATLAQLAYEQQIIEHEWKSIATQMAGLQQQYESLLADNLLLAGISDQEFTLAFARENDALKRHEYLQKLRDKAMTSVSDQKKNYPAEWKEKLFYRMMDIQALKLRFGSVTSRIKENIDRYQVLLTKYKTDPLIGTMIQQAEGRLKEVNAIFENAFEPEQYMTAAARMYRVY